MSTYDFLMKEAKNEGIEIGIEKRIDYKRATRK